MTVAVLAALLAALVVLLIATPVAHAQGAAPTVSTVAITSDPGTDNTYATGDTITVGVTFSEAVTVTGTPRITLDIGGQPRYASFSGDGTSAAAQAFSYTVLLSDQDAAGVSVAANSLALDGGAILATDDSAAATLTNSALSFANHKVDTEVVLASLRGHATETITISETQGHYFIGSARVSTEVGFALKEITLNVKTPSDSLDVTVIVQTHLNLIQRYTYSGSVTTAGPQTFTLTSPSSVKYGNIRTVLGGSPTIRFDVWIEGSGTGSVELEKSSGDTEGLPGWNLHNPRNVPHGRETVPTIVLTGYPASIPYLYYGTIVSSPRNGTAYTAGERIDMLFVFDTAVNFPETKSVPFWFGTQAQHRRAAMLLATTDRGRTHSFVFSYTVQPGDFDGDGVHIPANPLGNNASGAISLLPDSGVPANVSWPANQLGTSQAVNGSNSRECQEVFCNTMVAQELVDEEGGIVYRRDTGYSLQVMHNFPNSPLLDVNGLTFEYDNAEYAILQLVFTQDRVFGNELTLEFSPGLPGNVADRFAITLGGAPLLLEDANAIASRYYKWEDPGLTWAENDEIDFTIIETATVSFGEATYAEAEGNSVDVTVNLDEAFAVTTVTVPVTVTANGGATEADYSGIPENFVFAPGEASQTFTVTVEDDTEDDDEESVTLGFGDENHIRSGGDNQTTTITLADNDDPIVTVMYGQSSYTVAEGGTQAVTVTLSADPERELIIPLTDTPRGGATGDDYSVPASVTFSAGEMETSFTFAADQDTEDDDEDNVRLGFGTMPDARVSAGTTDETTVSITDDDDPFVTVMYGQSSYAVAEGGMQTIAVSLSANPERTVDIPLEVTHQGGATSADYSGVPSSVTFGSGETSKSFTFAADQDTEDDDEDSVLLSFGTMPDARVNPGTPDEATVSIADDDDPFVTVMFGQTDYVVVEGQTILVRAALSADPERTVVIPLTATNQDGASSNDYSGVPDNVTLSAGETSRTFEFTASEDSFADTGESVKLGFGTMPDARVSAGSPEEATVHIRQFSTEFTLDCMTSVWCADLQFSDQSQLDWGWALLEHGKRKDPASTLIDDSFTFRGVEYVVQAIRLRAGTYPTLANAWSREEQNESYLEIFIRRAEWSVGPSREHYQDWVLHMDGLQLPFQDTVDYQGGFLWIDADLQQFYNDWTSTKVTQIGIEERQDLPPSLAVPWLPRAVDAHGYYRNGRPELAVSWNSPHWHYPLPEPTGYIVQWKLASDSWDAPGAVDQMEVRGDHGRGVRIQGLRGNNLVGSALYSARVFAFNDVGDGPVSEDTLGRTQGGSPRLMATTVNGPNLTLRYDRDLDANSIPAAASFVVLVDAGLRAVTRVEVNGREVILTLFTPVHADNHVQAVYEEPNDPTATFLRDTDGQHVDLSSRSDRLQNVVNETPRTDLPPLTAEFANFPSSHDGSAPFTFNVEFSESVWISQGLPRDDMLEVVGGTVTSAHPDDRNTELWKVTVLPETHGDISITLPGGFCHHIYDNSTASQLVAGAPCAAGDRALSNMPSQMIPGPAPQQQVVGNTPATGLPVIYGIPELGQTLSADTSAVSDADGLDNAVFTYRWLADDVETGGATGSTHTLTDDDLGKAIRVRVDFTDDAGHEESLTSEPITVVATAVGPALRSATVDGATLTLTFDKTLDTGVIPPSGLFAVNVNGAPRSVLGVAVGETNVALLLSPEVVAGDAVTVAYTAPTDESAARLQDSSGNAAESFSGQAVTNDTTASGGGGGERSDEQEPPGVPENLGVDRHESGELLASWNAPGSGPAPTGYTVQWKESGDNWDDPGAVSETNVTRTSYVIGGLTDGTEYAARVVATRDGADSDPSAEVLATPRETVPPTLSSASVDGSILTLAFDEELDRTTRLSSGRFAVNVNGSPRPVVGVTVHQSNVLLHLSAPVAAGDTVTVDYTAPTDAREDGRVQDLIGNLADSFSGQAVTNETTASGGGGGGGGGERSDEQAPPGVPQGLDVALQQSGKLKATWNAPGSGPAPTGYTVQWKAAVDAWEDPGAVSETDVTKTSYVIGGLTDGVEYAARVVATRDGANSAPSEEVTAMPQETTPPELSSASVDGATLTLTFDEALDTDTTPHTSAFAVTVAGSSRGVEVVGVSGSAVTLTLVTAVFAGDAVTVDYTAPAGESASRLQDQVGNAAASFSGQSVTNRTPAAVQLTASAHDVPANHDGNSAFTFELRFSETPRKGFSYKTLRDHAFTVTNGDVTNARRLEKGKNVRWEIHVTPDGDGTVTVVLPVTTDCAATGAVCTSDGRMLSTRLELTVSGPGG